MLAIVTVLCLAVALVNGNPSGYQPKMSYAAPRLVYKAPTRSYQQSPTYQAKSMMSYSAAAPSYQKPMKKSYSARPVYASSAPASYQPKAKGYPAPAAAPTYQKPKQRAMYKRSTNGIMESPISTEPQLSIIGTLAKNSDIFSTLITAAKTSAVNSIGSSSTGGPFTLFAPTNDAFAALPEGTLNQLLASPEDLKKFLLSHMVSGSLPAMSIIKSGDLTTLSGSVIKVNASINGFKINEANVGNEFITNNGFIHTIDKVLLPKRQSIVDVLIKNSDTFSTLITAAKAADLVDTLATGGPFTLFAPTNDAFAALPEGALNQLLAAPEDLKKVLLGHVVSGSLPAMAIMKSDDLITLSGSVIKVNASINSIKVDGANMIGNEFIANNGVIHTIDKVLLPPPKRQSIVDILIENSVTFSTLITAAKAANLVDTLSTGGPFTLFAPTNAAFAALPESFLANLLASPKDLKKVLLGHVVSSNYPVALIQGGKLTSLDGGIHTVIVRNYGVTVDDATIIGGFVAANGVIQTIDNVLLPY